MKKVLILPYHVDNKLKDLDYLSEGILEELIYLFSTSSILSTTPRSTSLYLKNNPIPLNEIKERFNVEFLVEGNVKYKEGVYQISTRLFNTSNEELILNAQFNFQLDSWTQALDKLVHDISLTIRGITPPLSAKPEKDTSQAREYYLRGLYHWHRYTYDEMLLAIGFFRRSIKENESFALPYAAMADCYSIIGIMGFEQPAQAFKLAREFVSKALVLNNKRSDSYVSAAFVDMFYDRDYPQAKINLEQALRLSNENLKAHHALAMYYIHKGDLQNAEKHSAITIKLDPLALPHYAMMVRIQIYQRNFQLSMDYVNAALNIDDQSLPLIELRGYTNLFLGSTESAIEDFTICKENDDRNPLYLANLTYAYSRANFYQESREIEQQLHTLDVKKNTGIFDYALAIIKLGQSDYKAFFSHAEKAIDFVLGLFPGELKCNPIFIEVREDKRFKKILEQCNLSDEKPKYKKSRKPSTVITILSNTSETLSIDPQDLSFIEASDNYCTIYWYESGILKNKFFRLTLKSMEHQLSSFDYIVRCHKSFMVNIHQGLSITGNTRGHFFESPYLPVRIPISRSKANASKARLESLKE